jgi:hypothetical protein
VIRRPGPFFVFGLLVEAGFITGFITGPVKMGIVKIVVSLIVREVLEVPDEVVEGVTYVADVSDGIDAKCAAAWSRGC